MDLKKISAFISRKQLWEKKFIELSEQEMLEVCEVILDAANTHECIKRMCRTCPVEKEIVCSEPVTNQYGDLIYLNPDVYLCCAGQLKFNKNYKKQKQNK